MSWFRKNDPRSEYEGGGVQANTLFPKGKDALTASDKLRLQSITGQEDDPKAPPDHSFWYGGVEIPADLSPTISETAKFDAVDPY